MSELKPCPFCGGEANTLHRPHVIDWRYSVGCNDDECRGFIGLSWLYKTEAEAIAAWNSRAERTCKLDYERYCSNCGVYVHGDAVLVHKDLDGGAWTVVSKPVNYCPNCGARVIA